MSATTTAGAKSAPNQATGPDIADRDDCPECVAATPQACDDCGRSSEVTDPDPERDGKWLCARCHADRAREVAESC